MKLSEWLVRVAIKFSAMAVVVIAIIGASLMCLDAMLPKLMGRHYTMAGMYGVALLSAYAGACPLALAIERYALKLLRWPAWTPQKS